MALERSIRVADEAMGVLLYCWKGELGAGVESYKNKLLRFPLFLVPWRRL